MAKKNGKRVVLKKSSTRSLSNAKLVTIKGQKYYQIGRNQYVKASSVIAPIKKANVKATVKGRKNAKVRAYTSTGKCTRSYLSGRKSYKFTAKRSINGKTYYKVSGKNLWIPASKLNIR
ncbi:SLAP domain-containing protein [Lactobacillus amylovorus]|uniref:SLAP domain-containing protein n=1 Tax=Lactobacillus amylovorus TaxID=1604 RepID=UPI003A5CD967